MALVDDETTQVNQGHTIFDQNNQKGHLWNHFKGNPFASLSFLRTLRNFGVVLGFCWDSGGCLILF